MAVWIAREYPVPAGLGTGLASVLTHLITEEKLFGQVVDEVDVGTSPTMIAFGLSGFVREDFSKTYLSAPYPYVELNLLLCVRRGEEPLLGHDEIAAGNAGGGLTLLPLMWLQRTNDPSNEETQELLTICQRSFLHIHRGYRLSRIIKEASTERAAAFTAGGFRERCRLPVGSPLPWGETLKAERIVFEITRAEFEQAFPAGSAIGHLFPYRRPLCGFTRAEQSVLSRALDHLTDAEIARQLDVTEGAVAMR